MPDKEKMLKQLAGIGIALDMDGYHADAQCVRDALALLREQEPVEPFYSEADDSWGCGNCGETVGYSEFYTGGIDQVRNKYCPECGRKVNWDATD